MVAGSVDDQDLEQHGILQQQQEQPHQDRLEPVLNQEDAVDPDQLKQNVTPSFVMMIEG